MANLSSFHIIFFMFITTGRAAASTTEDSCPSTAWQGTLTRKDDSNLGFGGFQLNPGASVQLTDSSEWSGHIWARTGCDFDSSGHGSCVTGDCGVVRTCSDSGADSSVTMAEFTRGEKDSYDVRLVDGTNVKLGVKPQGDNNYLITFCPATVLLQNCGCPSHLCCSQFGYCGDTDDYCGAGCRSGPCKGSGAPSGGGSVGSIVTRGFFNNIINQADDGCAGKRFYTRDSFVNAAKTFPNFASSVTRREIATMFAHFTHETRHFCQIEEINGASRDYCDGNNMQYPCAPGKGYFGRGPIQLSWNYNYGPCGQSLGLNLLGQPELVGSNPTVAFRTGLWFWMNSVRPVLNRGFGATIRAINGMECNGGNLDAVNARIRYYRDYCGQLGVDPGPNPGC